MWPPPSFLCVRSNQWEEAFLSKWLTSIAALLFLLHHQSASYRTAATSSLESLRCSRRSSAGVQPRQHLVSKRRAQQGVRSATSHDRDLTYYPNHVWQVAKGRSGEREGAREAACQQTKRGQATQAREFGDWTGADLHPSCKGWRSIRVFLLSVSQQLGLLSNGGEDFEEVANEESVGTRRCMASSRESVVALEWILCWMCYRAAAKLFPPLVHDAHQVWRDVKELQPHWEPVWQVIPLRGETVYQVGESYLSWCIGQNVDFCGAVSCVVVCACSSNKESEQDVSLLGVAWTYSPSDWMPQWVN